MRQRRRRLRNTFGSTIRGAAASAVGTLAMDTLLYRRYRAGGGTSGFLAWETSAGLESWERAPAPALVGKQLVEHGTKRELSPRFARSLNNAVHWGLGLSTGAVYGLVIAPRQSNLWYGPPFGAAVWAGGYAVLPQLGVYEPIWKYDLKTLGKDLGAHLVFGTATAVAFRLLAGRGGRRVKTADHIDSTKRERPQ